MLSRLIAVAAYTILPLVGVLALGWDWREIVLLYWLENVALGVAMVIRILRLIPREGTGALGTAGFFSAHYGLFTVVHGVFVGLLVSGLFQFGVPEVGSPLAPEQPAAGPIAWGSILIVFAIGGAVQIIAAIVQPVSPLTPQQLMFTAYPRIVVLHVAVLGAAFLIAEFDLPAAAAIILIVLHGIVDGVAALIAHRRG
ncbi:DUF6498-containing protein [Microcella daejeonensis]|uniref:DUF6498-containing protein n=1 Tax=Microcella daejeonensis TaxID=2994971 RepID=A0A9E8ML20_9MICO|nr:DUF6498-containing protein [Microcella daejeonensis]WAB80731.1 DUF6498-containing protein [Microcella daejeonensis]